MMVEIARLVEMSQKVGTDLAFIQAAGGNTSVKLPDGLMAVKASGTRLDKVSHTSGLAVVSYQRINQYLQQYIRTTPAMDEQTVSEYILSQKLTSDERFSGRPSMETGFHTMLKKYVIHSHSVYVNTMLCSLEGIALMKMIDDPLFKQATYVEYQCPGVALTLAIRDRLNRATTDLSSKVFFLQNHGLIVTSDDWQECLDLHADVNQRLCENVNFQPVRPVASVLHQTDKGVKATNQAVSDFIAKSGDLLFFKTLFPDQSIFLRNNVGQLHERDKKVLIDREHNTLYYNTELERAKALDELIVATVFVFKSIKALGLTPNYIAEPDIEFLHSLASEKYRKQQEKNG